MTAASWWRGIRSNKTAPGYGVYGQAFNAAGAKSESEFRINITTQGDQKFPVVAADRLGRLLAAWTSSDGHGPGIFTRRIVKQIQ